MTHLAQLHEVAADRVVVDAGARWSQVLKATLEHGLTPPVLTDYLELSIGGTLSVGGVGGTSHHHGAQTDNVLELDVITPDGTLVTCSAERHPELFDAVRAGRGRSGVIVRATVRLVAAPHVARKYRLRYHDLGAFLTDQRQLVREGRFDYLEGQMIPVEDGVVYEIEAVTFGSASPDCLAHDEVTADEESPYWDFVNRLKIGEQLARTANAWTVPHYWSNAWLPDTAVEDFLTTVSNDVKTPLLGEFGVVLVYPLLTTKLTTPQMKLPPGDVIFLAAALRHAPTPDDAMDAANRRWSAEALARKGVLYLDPL